MSGGTTARVLGTSFVVRHYATDTTTVVAVQEGKVAVEGTVVPPRRLVEVDRHRMLQLEPADASRFTFATGVLTLAYMPLARAIPELDRWYNVDIQLDDPALGTQGIGGKFVAGSVADLAGVLELTFNVRVVRDGRTLTLNPR